MVGYRPQRMQRRRADCGWTGPLLTFDFLFCASPRGTCAVQFLATFAFSKNREDLLKRCRTGRHKAQHGEHVFTRTRSGVQIGQQHGNNRDIKMSQHTVTAMTDQIGNSAIVTRVSSRLDARAGGVSFLRLLPVIVSFEEF